jgi:hypothetical protein
MDNFSSTFGTRVKWCYILYETCQLKLNFLWTYPKHGDTYVTSIYNEVHKFFYFNLDYHASTEILSLLKNIKRFSELNGLLERLIFWYGGSNKQYNLKNLHVALYLLEENYPKKEITNKAKTLTLGCSIVDTNLKLMSTLTMRFSALEHQNTKTLAVKSL